jgi:hypothetical protein
MFISNRRVAAALDQDIGSVVVGRRSVQSSAPPSSRRLGESLAREEPGPFGDGSFGKLENVVLGASGLNVETMR